MLRTCPTSRNAGFTLVEMSMVLIIMSVVIGGGFSFATGHMERKKRELTEQRMDIIERALLDFRSSQNRMPCPADGSVNPDNAIYGIEAENLGSCTGGSPEANFTGARHVTKPGNPVTSVVGGTIPVVTLGLPKEIGLDGWGNKFSYHVDARATEQSAFSDYTIANSNCFSLIVDDERTWTADADRNYLSFHAVYVLMSHGKDGHGAFSVGGPRQNAAVTNQYQLQNANFDSAGAETTYNNLFHLISNREDPDDSKENYDDIVRFKNRVQLRTTQDGPGVIFPDLLISAHNSTASEYGINFYYRCKDAFILEPKEMSDINNKKIQRISVSKNNTYILGSTDNDYHFRMWTYDGINTNQLPDSSFLPYPNIPTGTAQNAIWADDGAYFLVSAFDGTGSQNRVGIYERSGINEFSLIDAAVENAVNSNGVTVLNQGALWGLNLSPDGNQLLLMYAGADEMKPMLFRRNADNTFSHVPNAIPDMVSDEIKRPEWSPDGNYLLMYHWDTTGLVWLFRNDGNYHYSRISDLAPMPTWTLKGASFSPDSRLLAIIRQGGGTGAPVIYELGSDSVYRQIADQPSAISGNNAFVKFSGDGNYLAFGKYMSGTSPTLYIYKVEGSTLRLLNGAGEGPSEQPNGDIQWAEWRRLMPWEKSIQ